MNIYACIYMKLYVAISIYIYKPPTHAHKHRKMTWSRAFTSWPAAMRAATTSVMPFSAAKKKETCAPCARSTAAVSSLSFAKARSNTVRPR